MNVLYGEVKVNQLCLAHSHSLDCWASIQFPKVKVKIRKELWLHIKFAVKSAFMVSLDLLYTMFVYDEGFDLEKH